jgi:multidrug resistance efflux pump
VRGHAKRRKRDSAREINVANAQPNGQGVATVNPIFTWVRLAHRIPVRIHIDQLPEGIFLVAGMTSTVQIDEPQDRQQKKRAIATGFSVRSSMLVRQLSTVTMRRRSHGVARS